MRKALVEQANALVPEVPEVPEVAPGTDFTGQAASSESTSTDDESGATDPASTLGQ